MVSRTRVSADSDVPILGRGNAGSCASGDDHAAAVSRCGIGLRLTDRSGRGAAVIQGDQVLLILGALSQAAHSDIEDPVLPENVVLHQRIRGYPTGSVAGSGAGKEAC